MQTINQLGQYFTTNIDLKNKVSEFVFNNPDIILEPSVGQGDLVEVLLRKNNKIHFDMYEIDYNIKLLEGIPKTVIYNDFLKQNISKTYTTIIGNPPFVRTQKGNLYIDFIPLKIFTQAIKFLSSKPLAIFLREFSELLVVLIIIILVHFIEVALI